MPIVRVALDVPLDKLFDYEAPDAATGDLGARVEVPFGKKRVVGVIVEIARATEVPRERLRSVTRILRDSPRVAAPVLALCRFCSSYYHHPLGQVIFGALPLPLRSARKMRLKPVTDFALTPEGERLYETGIAARARLTRTLLARLRQGRLSRIEALQISGTAIRTLTGMVAQGWVTEIAPERTAGLAGAMPPPRLNAEQESAVAAIENQTGFQPWLLAGITGSGKTEVYLRVIGGVLDKGGQALVLAPEINLTPQLEQLFRERFPQTLLVSQHSGLSGAERARDWMLAAAGDAGIVLGTRLAVFTPMPKLGLIVVDEENDASFKQQEGLRYSARDAAVFRARAAGCPVILGSATPSLESFNHSLNGRYRLLKITRRAAHAAQLPLIQCVDTAREKLNEGLSQRLVNTLAERLQRGEQSLIFINRRGYAPVLVCSACMKTSECTRCASRLVVHLKERKLYCHHCGHQEPVPRACPACGNQDLVPLGHGTQRIESALQSLFPRARIVRIDRDSTRRKDAFRGMLQQIQARRVDILVGTQMLAKGHDFPGITLVGVLNADASLYSADLRASERLFAQLTQVSGRAGRGNRPGEVLIQTGFPGHFLFQALKHQDYTEFAQMLLAERKQAEFPPFVSQALLRAEAHRQDLVMDFLVTAANLARRAKPQVTVYDAVPAPVARVAGKERGQLLIQSPSRRRLQGFLNEWHRGLTALKNRKVRWSLDVDPLDF